MKCKISKVYCSDKQGCFQLALQSSTVTKGMHRVLGLVAVHQCWVIAELYEVHNLLGVLQ